MIRHFPATVLAASLSLLALPTMPFATAVALRGDGYDCCGPAWGRLLPTRNRQASLVATSEADKRNQFPDGRPRQPEHLG
jgi:hypothetical protein